MLCLRAQRFIEAVLALLVVAGAAGVGVDPVFAERRVSHRKSVCDQPRDGASVATATGVPDEAYAGWPGDYEPTRLPWPIE